jgi:hypothetical protein
MEQCEYSHDSQLLKLTAERLEAVGFDPKKLPCRHEVARSGSCPRPYTCAQSHSVVAARAARAAFMAARAARAAFMAARAEFVEARAERAVPAAARAEFVEARAEFMGARAQDNTKTV